MPSFGLDVHAEAVEEAAAARRWYARRSEQAAADFMVELDVVVARILDAPERWPEYVLGTRKALMTRFPFAVIYRRRGGVVQVIAVAHGSRRPGYWRDRMSS